MLLLPLLRVVDRFPSRKCLRRIFDRESRLLALPSSCDGTYTRTPRPYLRRYPSLSTNATGNLSKSSTHFFSDVSRPPLALAAKMSWTWITEMQGSLIVPSSLRTSIPMIVALWIPSTKSCSLVRSRIHKGLALDHKAFELSCTSST